MSLRAAGETSSGDELAGGRGDLGVSEVVPLDKAPAGTQPAPRSPASRVYPREPHHDAVRGRPRSKAAKPKLATCTAFTREPHHDAVRGPRSTPAGKPAPRSPSRSTSHSSNTADLTVANPNYRYITAV